MSDYTWIDSLISSYYYNRDIDSIISMIQGTINRILDKSYNEVNAGDDDTDILMGAIVMEYGDYGTSPRFGWVDAQHNNSVLQILSEQLRYYKGLKGD